MSDKIKEKVEYLKDLISFYSELLNNPEMAEFHYKYSDFIVSCNEVIVELTEHLQGNVSEDMYVSDC